MTKMTKMLKKQKNLKMNFEEMNEEDLKLFKEKLEAEFDLLVESGTSIRSFLYLPHNFLTPKIKNGLDELLLHEAYLSFERGELTPENFIVYKDELITVRLDNEKKQVETLRTMIASFAKTEEYEKCAKLRELLLKIENSQS